MAREATYSLIIDTAQARREVRQFTQDVQRELQKGLSGPAGGSSVRPPSGTVAGGASALGGFLMGGLGGLAGYFSVREITQQTIQLSRLRSEVTQSRAAFELLSGSQAQAAANMAAVMRATQGTVTELEAQRLATTALATGLADSATELERITRVAQGIAVVSPVINDAAGAMEQLSLTMANMSFMRLDQLGLGATEVKERMAELQSTTAGMTKELAFQEAVLSIAEEKYGSLADSMAETISGADQLAKAWRDLQIALAEGQAGEVANRALENAAYALNMYSDNLKKVDEIEAAIEGLDNRISTRLDSATQTERFDRLGAALDNTRAAIEANVPGAENYADALIQVANQATFTNQVSDEMVGRLAVIEEWLGRTTYSALTTASAYDALARSAAGAAGAIGAVTRLSGPELLAAQRAGIMTPGERERRATAESVSTTSTADWERQYYLLRREEEEKAAAAAAKAWGSAAQSVADDWSAEIESALQGVEGLFDTSDVTQEDLAAAQAGTYLEKADEYLRQLRDEVRNGVDYAGVDIQDAARRLGIDPAAPAEEILKQFEQAWEDSSLFAGGQNLDLINEEAVKREIDRQKQSRAGEQAIIDYFTALYGPEAAQKAVGGGSYGYGYGGAPGASGAPLAGTDADGALRLNNLTVSDDALLSLQAQIDAAGIAIALEAPQDIASVFLNDTATQFANEAGTVTQLGATIGYDIAMAMQSGVTPAALTAYMNAIAGGLTPTAGDQAGGAQSMFVGIGANMGYQIAQAMRAGVTPDAAVAFLESLAAQFNAEGENDAVALAVGIGRNIQSWIGGGMIDFAVGGTENNADLAVGFLQGVSSSFYAEDAQTKAKTIGQDIRIPLFEGFRDTETLPNFALAFVPSLRSQFQEESVTDQLLGLGGTIIGSVYAGWAAGASEYDWVGPIVSAAQGQAAEQTVDAINESFTINLPGGSVTNP